MSVCVLVYYSYLCICEGQKGTNQFTVRFAAIKALSRLRSSCFQS